jgi:ketosteroid isomerase-like protein
MNDIVVAITAAYSEGPSIDFGALLPMLHSEVVLHVPGSHPLSGSYRGLEAIGGFIAASSEVTAGGERIRHLDTLVGDRHVAVLVHVSGERADGRCLDNVTMHLAEIGPDGLITSITFHNREQAPVDAFWS